MELTTSRTDQAVSRFLNVSAANAQETHCPPTRDAFDNMSYNNTTNAVSRLNGGLIEASYN